MAHNKNLRGKKQKQNQKNYELERNSRKSLFKFSSFVCFGTSSVTDFIWMIIFNVDRFYSVRSYLIFIFFIYLFYYLYFTMSFSSEVYNLLMSCVTQKKKFKTNDKIISCSLASVLLCYEVVIPYPLYPDVHDCTNLSKILHGQLFSRLMKTSPVEAILYL